MDLERREQPLVLAIRSNEKLWAVLDKRLGQHAASRLAASLPARAWRRLSAGAGSKGDRLYDWARLRLTRLQQPPWEHWLLVRRSCKDPTDLAYYVVYGPDRTTLTTPAQVAGRRRPSRTASRWPSRRSAWPITKSVPGTAGTGTSRWPCSL